MRKYLVIVAATGLLSLPSALAQGVLNLAPADAFLAISISQPQAVLDRTARVRQEFERLGVAGKLAAAFGEMSGPAGAPEWSPPGVIGRLLALDYQDAGFYLRPAAGESKVAFAALVRVAMAGLPAAERTLTEILAKARTETGMRVTEHAEGPYRFWLLEDTTLPRSAIALGSIVNTYVMASSGEEYRAIVRRAVRTGDPNLLTNPAYQRVNARLALDANFRFFIDWAGVSAVVENLVARGDLPSEFLPSRARLGQIFRTLGASGLALTVTADGLVGESVQAVDPAGGDRTLAGLLTDRGRGLPRAGELVPLPALSFSATSANTLPGLYDYLIELLGTLPEAPPDFNDLITAQIGLDLRAQVMAWQGSELASFTLPTSSGGRTGEPAANPLGEMGFILAVRDEARARAGMQGLVEAVLNLVAPPVTPAPRGRQAAPRPVPQQRLHRGVTYTILDLGGFGVAYTLVRGYAVLTTSEDSMRKVIDVATGAAPSILQAAGYQRLRGRIQPGAATIGFTDLASTLRDTAGQLQTTLFMVPTLAALSGFELAVDFRALAEAATALDEFLGFLAGRAGGWITSTTVSGNTIYERSFVSFQW